MRAEDLKDWLRMAEVEETESGFAGRGDTWRMLVKLVQNIWETGEIPRQMLWTIMVLIPKGNSGDFRGIGLLEVLWKVLEKVINARLSSSIDLHDALHGFRAGRGCGTGIMEAKLDQQLAFMEQRPLYGIFLDLRKAYDAMDRGRCMGILRDCGVGDKTLRLIAWFWRDAEMVCRASGYYGRRFRDRRGVIQGGPLSLTISN